MKKGFTLIELLIVIAIIGILAVAFLPSILGAPAKGRDVARIADLQKIQKVLVNSNLAGTAYPATDATKCFGPLAAAYLSDFGGKAPQDPQGAGATVMNTGCNVAGGYTYIKDPGATKTYSFGLYAVTENCTTNTVVCSTAITGTLTPAVCTGGGATAANELCNAVLTK